MTAETLPLVGYYQFDDILWIRSYGIGHTISQYIGEGIILLKVFKFKIAFHLVVSAV